MVLSVLWKSLAALLTSMRSRETSPLGNVTVYMWQKKKRWKKSNKTSPKPNIPFQWFYFGNGHKHTSYFSWLWLLWLPIMSASPLSAETIQKCKSQSQPSLTCPWDCGTWSSVTYFPSVRIVSFRRKPGVAKMHHSTKKSNLKWYWILAASCKTCGAFSSVLIIL